MEQTQFRTDIQHKNNISPQYTGENIIKCIILNMQTKKLAENKLPMTVNGKSCNNKSINLWVKVQGFGGALNGGTFTH